MVGLERLRAGWATHIPLLRSVACLAVGLVLVGGSTACGRSEFPDRTARVDIGGRVTTFTLDDCGLDGTTLFVVGRSTGGETLQAVVGVEADGATAVVDSTGLTVSDEGNELAAFGPEAWQRRGADGPAPGRVDSAELRGSRIRAAGELNTMSGSATGSGAAPAMGDQAILFSLDARCDDQST